MPELRGGHLWANDRPGFDVDIDEARVAKYPISVTPVEWTQSRWPDGTLRTPPAGSSSAGRPGRRLFKQFAERL